ncbi:helix-turn-helix domain-containing protein [Saccharopolyspora rosea]|uniref:helix-turn-helix domain-containing protein n=1 Tax=Saccharopolyspora rosea TaxID=524884 RepID=UPI0021D9BED5|nr:helix-turn-helix domain-containing protein [Saccharopolyspora rosea]
MLAVGDGGSAARGELERLRLLHRDATGRDGLERLVRRVARELGATAVLLDPRRRVLHAFPEEPPGPVLRSITAGVERMLTGGARSLAIDAGSERVWAFALGPEPASPVLVVVGEQAGSAAHGPFLDDALRLLRLCWENWAGRRRAGRLDRADRAVREAVLHMLMVGQQQAAHQTASALGHALPESVRVAVVEAASGIREVLAARLAEATRGRAWIVRCPVYSGHLIALVPADGRDDERVPFGELFSPSDRISVGASRTAHLHQVPAAYRQAFHALARARTGPRWQATFRPDTDLAAVVGCRGRRWAEGVLAPLTGHRPRRPQDPTAEELRATLRSWLAFHRHAARQLKIHRNTLAARIDRIEGLLGQDLHGLAGRAGTDLALRLLDAVGEEPADDDRWDDLGAILAASAVRAWANRFLRPLVQAPSGVLDTARVWIENGTHLESTAAVLGISVPAVRKRLHRAEEALERSLLRSPSACYDLHFAFRADAQRS